MAKSKKLTFVSADSNSDTIVSRAPDVAETLLELDALRRAVTNLNVRITELELRFGAIL